MWLDLSWDHLRYVRRQCPKNKWRAQPNWVMWSKYLDLWLFFSCRFREICSCELKSRQSTFKWCLRNRERWKTRSWRSLHPSQMNPLLQYQMWCSLPLSITHQKSQSSLMLHQDLMLKKVLRMWNRSKRHLKPAVASLLTKIMACPVPHPQSEQEQKTFWAHEVYFNNLQMHCFLGTLSFWKLSFSDSIWFEKGEKKKKKKKRESETILWACLLHSKEAKHSSFGYAHRLPGL